MLGALGASHSTRISRCGKRRHAKYPFRSRRATAERLLACQGRDRSTRESNLGYMPVSGSAWFPHAIWAATIPASVAAAIVVPGRGLASRRRCRTGPLSPPRAPIRWASVCPAPASRRGRAGALAARRRVAVGPRGVVAAGVEHQRQPRDEEDRPSGRDEDGSKGGSCHVSSSVRQHHASGAVTGPGQPGPAPPAPGRGSREPAGSGRPPERPGRSTPPRPDGRSGSCSPVHSRPRAR
jgi:hypothetical protein